MRDQKKKNNMPFLGYRHNGFVAVLALEHIMMSVI